MAAICLDLNSVQNANLNNIQPLEYSTRSEFEPPIVKYFCLELFSAVSGDPKFKQTDFGVVNCFVVRKWLIVLVAGSG